jgi:hypothetical protein
VRLRCLVHEDEWSMDEVFKQLGTAFGGEVSKFCLLDDKGKPKMVKKSKDHFALLLLWSIKQNGTLNVAEC